MKIPILKFLFLFFFGVCSIQPSCAINEIYMMDQRLLHVMRQLPKAPPYNGITIESLIDTSKHTLTPVDIQIRIFLHSVMVQVNKMKQYDDLSDIFGMVKNLIAPELQFNISLLNTHISAVRKQFDLFFEYFQKGEKTSVQTWQTFAETNIGVIEDHLKSLQIAMFPPKQKNNVNPGLIPTIARASETFRNTYCTEASMMYYVLSHLFQAARVTEIRGAAMLIYASMIQYAKDDEWRTKIRIIEKKFSSDYWIAMSAIQRAMDIAPEYVRACDPPNGTWIRDTTYFEMEKFEQISIFQYNILSHWSKDCNEVVKQGGFTYDSEIDRCSGKLSDCKYSGVVHVCRLKNDTKRYEWIKSDEAGYGMNFDKCPNGEQTFYDHWWSNFPTGHCMCNCREADKNWISLSPVMTNKTENMVVIGLRFMRKKRVLYIQVKEGKLLTNGWIDPASQRWIPLPEKPEVAVINAANNKFYLDEVRALPDYTIIGIQIEETDGFSIAAVVCDINATTGQLNWNYQSKVDADDYDYEDYKYLPLPKRNSIYTHLPHKPDSDRNWIKLQVSDWKDDAGQSTVPLFDGVAVETIPPFPVEGVGIFHKGVDNFAGFLSLKLLPRRYQFVAQIF